MSGVTTNLTITDANVNGGVGINMTSTKITILWEVYNSTNTPIPNQSSVDSYDGSAEPSDWSSRLAKSQYTGFGNPKITVEGKINIDNSHATNNSNNVIDYEFLQMLSASSAVKALSGGMIPSSRDVVITNITMTHPDDGNIVTYTMVLREVQT